MSYFSVSIISEKSGGTQLNDCEVHHCIKSSTRHKMEEEEEEEFEENKKGAEKNPTVMIRNNLIQRHC